MSDVPVSTEPLLMSMRMDPSRDTQEVQIGGPTSSLSQSPLSKSRQLENEASMYGCEVALQFLFQRRDPPHELGMYGSLLIYKNRWLKGNLLHYAIWRSRQPDFSSKTSVRNLWDEIERRERDFQVNRDDPRNLNDTGSQVVEMVLDYARRRGITVQREPAEVESAAAGAGEHQRIMALHLAAGLGCVSTVKNLVEQSRDAERTVNERCVVGERLGGTALHEATWCGHIDIVQELLRLQADASIRDANDRTPLHILAFRGGCDVRIQEVVKQLIERKARVDDRTSKRGDLECMAGKTPLEIASQPGSQFPRSDTYILAKCWSAADAVGRAAEESFLDDLLFVEPSAAEALARQLKNHPQTHRYLRMDAQEYDAANKLASLVYTAPWAAVDIFDVLTVTPAVPDPMHSPLASRLNMAGFLEDKLIRCTYQSDVMHSDRDHGVTMPVWFAWAGDKQSWHYQFIKDVYRPGKGRQERVKSVDMKVILLPNALDLDIVWALARTWKNNWGVFLSLPINGLITGLWCGMVEPVYGVDLCIRSFELAAVISWGLRRHAPRSPFDHSMTSGGTDYWSLNKLPFYWVILAAGFIRESCMWVCWLVRFWKKSVKWRFFYRPGEFSRAKINRYALPQWSTSLWSMRSFCAHTTALPELFLQIVPMGCLLWKAAWHTPDRSPDEWFGMQPLLALCIIMRCFRMLITLRVVSGVGRRITAIINAFVAGNMVQMLGITMWTYFAFIMASQPINPQYNLNFLSIYLYRGLIFGDDNAFDKLSLSVLEEDELPESGVEQHQAMTALMVVATLIFNIVILNLIIAVYEREYGSSERRSIMAFTQARAAWCVKYMLQLPRSGPLATVVRSLQIIHVRGPFIIAAGMMAMGLLLPLLAADEISFSGGTLIAVILAAGEGLLLLALFQNLWGSNKRAVRNTRKRVLSFRRRSSTQAAEDWKEDNGEEHEAERFLWICHATNFDEMVNNVSAEAQ